jgi:predicted nucleic acid-binding protein
VIVLSDTSPINHLVLIENIEILPALFGQVVIPTSVLNELQHSGTPAEVQRWIGQPPPWLQVRSASHIDPLLRLGSGETEAISLAIEIHASLVLMDDRRGRREAESRGLSVAGTLSVLEAAAARDLLDLPTAIAKLRRTHFNISERILQRALQTDAARRKQE